MQSTDPATGRPFELSELIDLIVTSVNLQFMDRSTIKPETVLTQGGLGLDSIDILEVVVAVEHKFGVKLKDPKDGPTHFKSIGTIADFILSSHTGKSGNA